MNQCDVVNSSSTTHPILTLSDAQIPLATSWLDKLSPPWSKDVNVQRCGWCGMLWLCPIYPTSIVSDCHHIQKTSRDHFWASPVSRYFKNHPCGCHFCPAQWANPAASLFHLKLSQWEMVKKNILRSKLSTRAPKTSGSMRTPSANLDMSAISEGTMQWNACVICVSIESLQQLYGAHPSCLRQKLSTSQVFHWNECSNDPLDSNVQ